MSSEDWARFYRRARRRPATFAAGKSVAERIVSHYAIERSLGAGGMGEVFLARDLALGRPVALKLLTGSVGPAALERFRREAEACARVQHPAIATFYEAGEADGVAFLAMEFVAAETLR